MNLQSLARVAMVTTQQAKAHQVTIDGIGEPIPASLVMMKGDLSAAIAYFDWDGSIRALITIRSLISLIDCDAVALALETFTMAGEVEELEAVSDFAQAFADGDKRVNEAIVVFAINKAGDECMASCHYTYEGRKVRYSEVAVMNADPEGAVSSAIRSGFAKQGTTPTCEPDTVSELLGVTITIPRIIGPN